MPLAKFLTDSERERSEASPGLEVNLYSFKTKKIPAGRVALGDWLGYWGGCMFSC